MGLRTINSRAVAMVLFILGALLLSMFRAPLAAPRNAGFVFGSVAAITACGTRFRCRAVRYGMFYASAAGCSLRAEAPWRGGRGIAIEKRSPAHRQRELLRKMSRESGRAPARVSRQGLRRGQFPGGAGLNSPLVTAGRRRYRQRPMPLVAI